MTVLPAPPRPAKARPTTESEFTRLFGPLEDRRSIEFKGRLPRIAQAGTSPALNCSAAAPRMSRIDFVPDSLSLDSLPESQPSGSVRGWFLRSASAVLCVLFGTLLPAGEAQLKNGTLIEGHLVPVRGLTSELARQTSGPVAYDPILMIDNEWQRYFVPQHQVAGVDNAVDITGEETFYLKHKRVGRRGMMQSIGGYRTQSPFSEYGRRTITLKTPRGQEEVIQGVIELAPSHLTISALSHEWEFGLATTSIPADVLDSMLRQAASQRGPQALSDPETRMAIARFYLQAGLYPQAQKELDAIAKAFPELADRVEEISVDLRQHLAGMLLHELRLRREAGQHHLAYASLQDFPLEKMEAGVVRQVRDMLADYHDAQNRADHVLVRLGELQSQLSDADLVSKVMPLRSFVSDALNYESLDRMHAFLELEADSSLSAEEKLALAYSGWIRGSANATTDLEATLRLWQARFLILEYLREESAADRGRILTDLSALEGISPRVVAELVPSLPPPVETAGLQPGRGGEIAVRGREDAGIRYSVLLPPEYVPHHHYPLLVVLHPAERAPEDELEWWGGTAQEMGQAQRRGYIVIAPHYANEHLQEYDYSPGSHETVLESIRDARQRFQVDSDRVFLAGHGTGADAAFDMGMSHPDVFAGVIPISGYADKYCKWYFENGPELPWYIVRGELDLRPAWEANLINLNRMMRLGRDVIYAEYIGRGYESYYAEIHKLFDWMERQRRVKHPKEFEVNVLRPSENRFHWVEMQGFPDNLEDAHLAVDDPTTRGRRVRPMRLKANITDGHPERATFYVSSGADKHILYLSPEIVDYDRKISVVVNGRRRTNEFLSGQIDVMLEDLRVRGDRQMLYWTRLEF